MKSSAALSSTREVDWISRIKKSGEGWRAYRQEARGKKEKNEDSWLKLSKTKGLILLPSSAEEGMSLSVKDLF